MSFGLECYNGGGTTTFSTPTNEVYYFDQTNSCTSASVALGSGTYDSLGAVLARNSQYYNAAFAAWRFQWRQSSTLCSAISAGVVSNGTYYPPSKSSTLSCNVSNTDFSHMAGRISIGRADTTAYSFGKLPNPASSSGYGFLAINNNNYVVVNDSSSPIYIQPKANGETIYTVNLNSEGLSGSAYRKFFLIVDTSMNYAEKAATITFEKAYTKPPLIFLTDSSGVPISIYGYIKNASGQFTGVTLTTAANPSGPSSWNLLDTAGWNRASYYFSQNVPATVSVMVVSEEFPDYAAQGGWGMQTYNSAGQVLFDSRFSPLAFSIHNRSIPYYRVRGSWSSIYTFNMYIDKINDNSWSETGLNKAICLNSFTAITGILCHGMRWTDSTGDMSWMSNFYGRYASISKDATTTTFGIHAGGTAYLGESTEDTIDFYSGNRQFPSYSADAHLGSTSTMDVLTLDY